MNIIELRNYILAVLLGFAALTMLPACSSTEEAPPPEESSGGGGDTSDLEDCSVYTGQVDISECEMRNQMRQ